MTHTDINIEVCQAIHEHFKSLLPVSKCNLPLNLSCLLHLRIVDIHGAKTHKNQTPLCTFASITLLLDHLSKNPMNSNKVIEANVQGGLVFMCFSTMYIYYPKVSRQSHLWAAGEVDLLETLPFWHMTIYIRLKTRSSVNARER